MLIYLAAAPDEAREAARFRRPLAHRAYRIGPESTLLRRNLLLGTQGGLLAVTDQDAPPVSRPEDLAAAAVRECGRRSYSGGAAGADAASRAGPAGPGGGAGAGAGPPPPLCPGELRLRAGDGASDLHRPLRRELHPASPGGGRRRRGPAGAGCGAAADGLPPPPPPAAKGGPSAAGSSGTCWTGRLRRCSSPRISAPGTSPTPGGTRPTSSSSTMPTPSSRSCGPAALWASPPPFSCSRRCGTFCPACSRPGGTESGRVENQKCCTGPVQHFFINSSASCSCERLRTSCGA